MEETAEKLAVETRNLERLKDLLVKSSSETREMCSILCHFDERLSKLEETIQPVYRETGNLQQQQDNILKTLDYLDYVIRFYTVAGEVEPIVRTGPLPGSLNTYLQALDRLQEAVRYFEDKNRESPELLNVSSLFERGCDFVEKEFRQLLSRHSNPVPAVVVMELVQEDENTSDSDRPVLEQLPEKAKNELRMLSKWLCEYKGDDFISVYAGIRSEVLMKSLTGLRAHLRSASGALSQTLAHGTSPLPTRKSLTASSSTPSSKKTPKGMQQAIRKLIPGELLGTGTPNASDARDDPAISEREIVSYLTSVTALYKLMQSELKLMEGIIPFQFQKPIFSRLVAQPLTSIVKEGDDLAARVKRCVSRNEFTPVLSLFPILRHQAEMRHYFDLILDGCSQEVISKFQGLVINLQTTISKALNEFIDFVKSDADTKVPRDGTVHELTSNVMIFLVNLQNYMDILSRVITGPSSEAVQRSKDRNRLVYAQYISRVLVALGSTLKNKGEVYNDPFLRAIFMLNNFHYILKTLRKSGLMAILNLYDRDAEVFYEELILESKKEYSKSWSRILHMLRDVDSGRSSASASGHGFPAGMTAGGSFSSGGSSYDLSQQLSNMKLKEKERQAIKEKFSLLNREFEEIRKAQTAYAIPDTELREMLKKDNRDFILPRYTAFYNSYAGLNFTKHTEKYVRYSPQELADTMATFFDSAA